MRIFMSLAQWLNLIFGYIFDSEARVLVYLLPGDILHGRCEFVSTRDITTRIGSTGEDEMCNFYMMYYMDAAKFRFVKYVLITKICMSLGIPC